MIDSLRSRKEPSGDYTRTNVGEMIGTTLTHHHITAKAGRLKSVARLHHLVRQPPQILDERQLQHARPGPQLADRQRSDGLVAVHKTQEFLSVQATVAVADAGTACQREAALGRGSLGKRDARLLPKTKKPRITVASPAVSGLPGTEKPPLDGLQKGVLLNLATKACRSIDDAWLFRGDFFDSDLLRLRDGCSRPHFFRRRGKHSLPTTLPPDPTIVFSATLGPLLHVKPPSRKSDLVRFLVRAGLHLGSVLCA